MPTPSANTLVFELKLDAEAENMLIVRQALDGVAAALSMDKDTREDVKLAVTEACTNVVKYAYSGEPGPMTLSVDADDESLGVTVTDQGSWRTPGADGTADAPGHGLAVIESICESLDVDGTAEGTTVSMKFRLHRRDGLNGTAA